VSTIETVTGPIPADRLGTTLIHEHLMVRDEAVHLQWPSQPTFGGVPPRALPAGSEYDAALESARAAAALGVHTIVDPTTIFIGRDVELMRRVSEASGVRVVACTGIYTFGYLPDFFVNREVDVMADLFVRDIEQGVQGTAIKAAFIKCAADEPGITPGVEKVHRASARASLRTGAPIMAHSCPDAGTGPLQVELFLEEGVDPARIQIAHTGDTDDLDYIERLLETGVTIGLDRFGLEAWLPFENRIETVLRLLERGYADRIFLSADSCATIDQVPPEESERSIAAGELKDADIRIVCEQVLPALRERGVTEAQIETLMVTNPMRWLEA
jgi:phosphotriesterase-related protein